MAQFSIKGFYEPTPVKWRKIGDAVLYFSVSMIPVVHSCPLSANSKLWVVSALAAYGVAGKTITNFFIDNAGENEQPGKS